MLGPCLFFWFTWKGKKKKGLKIAATEFVLSELGSSPTTEPDDLSRHIHVLCGIVVGNHETAHVPNLGYSATIRNVIPEDSLYYTLWKKSIINSGSVVNCKSHFLFFWWQIQECLQNGSGKCVQEGDQYIIRLPTFLFGRLGGGGGAVEGDWSISLCAHWAWGTTGQVSQRFTAPAHWGDCCCTK